MLVLQVQEGGGQVSTYEQLAALCERMGWSLELDPHWHDHGYDREGWLQVRTPEVFVGHKAAGESWDRAAERLLDSLREVVSL
jgi:hypothetical protein